jgi:hypothetical protein
MQIIYMCKSFNPIQYILKMIIYNEVPYLCLSPYLSQTHENVVTDLANYSKKSYFTLFLLRVCRQSRNLILALGLGGY